MNKKCDTFAFMETKEIIRAIEKLPISKRVLIIERTLKTIRESVTERNMEEAADSLRDDYINNNELTAFSQLDCEDFYEAR